jgi:ankyrin repeat protein
MKFLNIAAVALALAAIAAPAGAQMGGSASYQFLEAVKNADGTTGLELLKQHPTIVDTKDSDGNTALLISIARGDANWTGFLLNNGADPNLAGAGGDTPLIAAARAGFNEASAWLLELGAKVDGINRMGETALIIAVQRRNLAMVRRLLAAGADPDRPDAAAGYSARDYAKRDTRSRDILKLIEERKPKP